MLEQRMRQRTSIDSEETTGSESQLWVDKYAPESFLDLISDERTNRQVLHWVKTWDPIVFGRPGPAPLSTLAPGQWKSGISHGTALGRAERFAKGRF